MQGFHPQKWADFTTTVNGPEVQIFRKACIDNEVTDESFLKRFLCVPSLQIADRSSCRLCRPSCCQCLSPLMLPLMLVLLTSKPDLGTGMGHLQSDRHKASRCGQESVEHARHDLGHWLGRSGAWPQLPTTQGKSLLAAACSESGSHLT